VSKSAKRGGLVWTAAGAVLIGAGILLILASPRAIPERALTPYKPDHVNGETMFNAGGCAACHTVHGKGGNPGVKAPEMGGLFGSVIELEDGQHIQVTEEYVLESIIDPDAKVHKGYTAGIMPKAFAYLEPADLEALIAFLKSLPGPR